MARVKVSVYVPAELHRRAKYVSFEKGTTIQRVVEDALQTALDPEKQQPLTLKPKEIQMVFSQLRQILDSGNEFFITNCVSCIRGTYGLLKEAERRVGQTENVVPIQQPPDDVRSAKRRRKRGADGLVSGSGS